MEAATRLNPVFNVLDKPETIKNGVLGLIKPKTAIEHYKVLEQLLVEITNVDFKSTAFPQSEKLAKMVSTLEAFVSESGNAEHPTLESKREELNEKKKELSGFKLNQKHHLIIAIEELLKVAKENRWGLGKNNDFIYLFNGCYWHEVEKENFQSFLGEAAEKMGVTKYDARYFLFRDNLFKQFLSTAYLPTPTPDNKTVLINLMNGTFEITPRGNKLRSFNRKDFITYQLPFEYDPEAKAPIFKKYLDEVLPDMDRQKVLAEYLGMVFIRNDSGTMKEEKALLLYGSGANGKSVFFEIVNAILGEQNISYYSLTNLTDDSGYYRAKIANKLVNYASEISTRLEASTFKKIVSGEPLDARLPYGQPLTIKQYARLIFNCNVLPKDVEHTDAFFRRFLIIPFDVTIPEEKQDKELHIKIIENELSGVFNWVLEGLERLLKQKKFTKCEAAKLEVEKFKKESDSVRMFMDESGYKSHDNEYETIKTLYQNYRGYCAEEGSSPVNRRNFKDRLKHHKVLITRNNRGDIAYLTKEALDF